MNKQYYFWVSSTFILLAIISVFAGFTAKGIDFIAFTPWLSTKRALALSLMVLFGQLPAIIIMFIDKKGSKNLSKRGVSIGDIWSVIVVE